MRFETNRGGDGSARILFEVFEGAVHYPPGWYWTAVVEPEGEKKLAGPYPTATHARAAAVLTIQGASSAEVEKLMGPPPASALAYDSDAALDPTRVVEMIGEECEAIRAMLVGKNQSYGNSALDPVRVFSSSDSVEQIKVRIDDKLSRLKRGQSAGEDVVKDLIGYLILLRIAERKGG